MPHPTGHSLCQVLCFAFTESFTPQVPMSCGCYHYSHFTDEETGAQRRSCSPMDTAVIRAEHGHEARSS